MFWFVESAEEVRLFGWALYWAETVLITWSTDDPVSDVVELKEGCVKDHVWSSLSNPFLGCQNHYFNWDRAADLTDDTEVLSSATGNVNAFIPTGMAKGSLKKFFGPMSANFSDTSKERGFMAVEFEAKRSIALSHIQLLERGPRHSLVAGKKSTGRVWGLIGWLVRYFSTSCGRPERELDREKSIVMVLEDALCRLGLGAEGFLKYFLSKGKRHLQNRV